MRARHRRLRKRSPPRPAATSSSCRSRSVERRTRQLGDRQVPPTAATTPFALITALCFFRVRSISCSCAVALSRGRAPTLANRLIFGAQFGSQRSRRRRETIRTLDPPIYGELAARARDTTHGANDRICHQGRTPNCGGRRDSLITAETSLIARFNSLQGRKKFPVRMHRELARKKLISCPFSLSPRCRRGSKSIKFPVFSLLAGNFGIFRDEFAADSLLQRGVSNETCGCRGRRTRVGPRVQIRFASASPMRLGGQTVLIAPPHPHEATAMAPPFPHYGLEHMGLTVAGVLVSRRAPSPERKVTKQSGTECLELTLDHRLDQFAHPVAQTGLDRIKPIVEKMDRRLASEPRTGDFVLLSGMAWSPPAHNAGIVGFSAPGDYATFNSNHTPDGTEPGTSLLSSPCRCRLPQKRGALRLQSWSSVQRQTLRWRARACTHF